MAARHVFHNLPERAPRFFGLERQGCEVLGWLTSTSLQPIFAIEGLGAFGKTAFALQLAWSVVELSNASPFNEVLWLSASSPALWPIGPTPSPRRADTTHHTLARICESLGILRQDTGLLEAAHSLKRERQLRVLQSVFSAQATLLVLDEFEQVGDEKEEALLHTLLRTLPAPSRALVTARRDHGFPSPMRLLGLADEELDAFLDQECLATGISLDTLERRIVRTWACGLPYAVRVALCRVQLLGHDRALAELAHGPAPLMRPVVEQLLHTVHRERPDAYDALFCLANSDIERGITRGRARWILAPYNSSRADELLDALLDANLVVCVYHTNAKGEEVGYFTILPLVLRYLRQCS